MKFKLVIVAVCYLAMVAPSTKADGIAVEKLDGYQCMSLAKLWDGQGPQPPPTKVYGSPDAKAAVGFAANTVIVRIPVSAVNGRIPMLWPDGKTVWIDEDDVVRWHVVSDANAHCTPVLLSNGRYGTDGTK